MLVSNRLSQLISNRWRNLSAAGREFYQQVARVDFDNYESYLAQKQASVETTSVELSEEHE
jgi:hypothetical protein